MADSVKATLDITNISDIKKLVDNFYEKVRKDDLIGPIFNNVIQDNWGVHLEIMYRFWQTLLLNEHTYHGAPFLPHMELPIEPHHFDRWMKLFNETVEENFTGEVAEEAKWRASKMATLFMGKLDYYRKNKLNPLI